MKRYNKTYARKLTLRQIKIRKWLAFLLFVCISFAGFGGWMLEFPEYAVAEVNVAKPMEDNRSIEEHIWAIMDEYNFTLEQKIKGLSVMICESNGNPYAIGDSGKSLGLWQIHRGYHPTVTPEQAFDVYASTRWSIEKALKDGKGKPSWSAWTCGR
jgi:hypothetical protein